jgi:restriction endonuclease S subunit
VIAASTLHVLRVNEDVVSPFYLVWYLNLSQTKDRLRTMQAGSSIPFISIDDLGQLPVHLPSMELQDKIVDLVLLGQEEQALMELLRRKRIELVSGSIQSLLNKSK